MVVAVLIIVALILVNALYVAAEFAAVSVRRSRIQQLAADGNPLAAWLLPLIGSPVALDRYIAACQIGITLSSLVLGAYATNHNIRFVSSFNIEKILLMSAALAGDSEACPAARAGASFRPSPTIKTLRPLCDNS